MTAPMVMKEFLRHRVAPLHRHSRPMWALSGGQDRMRLQESGLPPEARRTVLEVLTGDPSPADMPQDGCLLYCCSNRVEFAGQMPPFDEMGLLPVGLLLGGSEPLQAPQQPMLREMGLVAHSSLRASGVSSATSSFRRRWAR